jgi:hypothetical protein
MMHHEVAHYSVLVLAWLLALVWVRRAWETLRGMRSMIDITQLDQNTLPQLPEEQALHVSVIVPARDEEDTIETTLRSLLAQTGIHLQIVAVDDRSGDSTGAKMDALAHEAAGGPHQLDVLHIHELPSGWLGKPHALAQGVKRARAPWLLFTDGDVIFAPEALHLAVRTAIREHADHFVLAPTLISQTIGAAATQATSQVLAHFVTRVWKIADDKAKDAFGVGGFNLVRAEAMAALGGIERMRMEVVEDVALGWLVKRELKRHSLIVLGPGLVKLHWIQGIFGIVKLLEKNAFAGMRFSVGMAFAAVLGLVLHAMVPFAALAAGPWGTAAGASIYLGIALSFAATRRLNGLSPWLAAFFAPCALILAWAILRSMVVTLARGGVIWRGTLYPLAELKMDMVKFRMV